MKIVFFTGAGISAESGIPTFRDSGGLWEKNSIEDIATPAGWEKDPAKVLKFYNDMRGRLKDYDPNKAHFDIAELESSHEVQIVTQNVDDLHERAGSSNVVHMHGSLLKMRSSIDANLFYDYTKDIEIGDVCELASQLRPHVVWFGEGVYNLNKSYDLIEKADAVVVVGTSLQVAPASYVFEVTSKGCLRYYVDPGVQEENYLYPGVKLIKENATTGVAKAIEEINKEEELWKD